MTQISAILYTTTEFQLSYLVMCFSRASAFGRVPLLETTSYPVQRIISVMIAASTFSYEDVCKDMGFSIYVQLYIRVHYTPKRSSPEQSYRTGVIDGGEYYSIYLAHPPNRLCIMI